MSNVISFADYRARQRSKARHAIGTTAAMLAAFRPVTVPHAYGEVLDRDFDYADTEYAAAIESVALAMTSE